MKFKTYDNNDAMMEDFDVNPKPVIPENLFASGVDPDGDDWLFDLIPFFAH